MSLPAPVASLQAMDPDLGNNGQVFKEEEKIPHHLRLNLDESQSVTFCKTVLLFSLFFSYFMKIEGD